MKEKYYICEHCGDLTTESQLREEAILCGRHSLCYCAFDHYYWSNKWKRFEPVYFREFYSYVEIPRELWKGLQGFNNEVVRLKYYHEWKQGIRYE